MLSFQDLLNEVKQHNIDEQLALFTELGLNLSHKNLDLAKITALFKETPSNQDEMVVASSLNNSSIEITTTFEGKLTDSNDFQVWVLGKNSIERLPLSGYAKQIAPMGYSWDQDKAGQIALAHSILAYQFGVSIADEYAWDFNSEKLKQVVANPNWKLNGDEISLWVEVKLAAPKEYDWKQDYADYLTEKHK